VAATLDTILALWRVFSDIVAGCSMDVSSPGEIGFTS
jgi:hypothetical protein